jgi:hypothetical protein
MRKRTPSELEEIARQAKEEVLKRQKKEEERNAPRKKHEGTYVAPEQKEKEAERNAPLAQQYQGVGGASAPVVQTAPISNLPPPPTSLPAPPLVPKAPPPPPAPSATPVGQKPVAKPWIEATPTHAGQPRPATAQARAHAQVPPAPLAPVPGVAQASIDVAQVQRGRTNAAAPAWVPQSFEDLWANSEWKANFLAFAASVNSKAVDFLAAIDGYKLKPSWKDADRIHKEYFEQLTWLKPDAKKFKDHMNRLQFMDGMAVPPSDMFDSLYQTALQILKPHFRQFMTQKGYQQ